MIQIRKEESSDSQEIRIVIQNAFGQTEEADLVDRLPDEAFMILVFDLAALERVSGVAKYRPEFNSVV